MKVIIAGSRTIKINWLIPVAVANSGFYITEIVSGCAQGVDKLGEKWAEENDIKVAKFPANWSLYGRAAGPIRNTQMAEYADALIAIWDGKSKGTYNMIKVAKSKGIKVFVYAHNRN